MVKSGVSVVRPLCSYTNLFKYREQWSVIKEMLNGADGVCVCVCVPEMMPKSFFRNRNRCPDECVT